MKRMHLILSLLLASVLLCAPLCAVAQVPTTTGVATTEDGKIDRSKYTLEELYGSDDEDEDDNNGPMSGLGNMVGGALTGAMGGDPMALGGGGGGGGALPGGGGGAVQQAGLDFGSLLAGLTQSISTMLVDLSDPDRMPQVLSTGWAVDVIDAWAADPIFGDEVCMDCRKHIVEQLLQKGLEELRKDYDCDGVKEKNKEMNLLSREICQFAVDNKSEAAAFGAFYNKMSPLAVSKQICAQHCAAAEEKEMVVSRSLMADIDDLVTATMKEKGANKAARHTWDRELSNHIIPPTGIDKECMACIEKESQELGEAVIATTTKWCKDPNRTADEMTLCEGKMKKPKAGVAIAMLTLDVQPPVLAMQGCRKEKKLCLNNDDLCSDMLQSPLRAGGDRSEEEKAKYDQCKGAYKNMNVPNSRKELEEYKTKKNEESLTKGLADMGITVGGDRTSSR